MTRRKGIEKRRCRACRQPAKGHDGPMGFERCRNFINSAECTENLGDSPPVSSEYDSPVNINNASPSVNIDTEIKTSANNILGLSAAAPPVDSNSGAQVPDPGFDSGNVVSQDERVDQAMASGSGSTGPVVQLTQVTATEMGDTLDQNAWPELQHGLLQRGRGNPRGHDDRGGRSLRGIGRGRASSSLIARTVQFDSAPPPGRPSDQRRDPPPAPTSAVQYAYDGPLLHQVPVGLQAQAVRHPQSSGPPQPSAGPPLQTSHSLPPGWDPLASRVVASSYATPVPSFSVPAASYHVPGSSLGVPVSGYPAPASSYVAPVSSHAAPIASAVPSRAYNISHAPIYSAPVYRNVNVNNGPRVPPVAIPDRPGDPFPAYGHDLNFNSNSVNMNSFNTNNVVNECFDFSAFSEQLPRQTCGEPGIASSVAPRGAEHVDDKIRIGAIRGEYVELSDLLSGSNIYDVEEIKTVIDASGCLSLKPSKSKKIVGTSFKWIEAWTAYELIMSHAHGLELLTEMAKYRMFIISHFSKYKLPHTLYFDMRHRQILGARRSLDFNNIENQLYITSFDWLALKASSRCNKCGGDHPSSDCPFRAPGQAGDLPRNRRQGERQGDKGAQSSRAGEICFKYNDGKCTAGAKCLRRHACAGCGGPEGRHACTKCNKSSKLGTSSGSGS